MSTLIWRIARRKYLDTSFSGIGASKVGGCWNSKGKSVVYCSATLSLAALEKFVHMELRHLSKQNLICFSAEIPDLCAIQTLEMSQLPQNWRTNEPYHPELTPLGDAWLDSLENAILRVPSAIIPQEYNYLLNPDHPDFSCIKIHDPEAFEFDDRLWKT